MNEILLSRKNKIVIPTFHEECEYAHYVAAINKNIESLGYCFSKQLFDALSKCDVSYLISFHQELVDSLCYLVGADVEYNPMYPNFPESVMNRYDFQLYFSALLHYWSSGTIYPMDKEKPRVALIECPHLTILDIGTDKEYQDIIDNLIQSKTPLSVQDKEDIAWHFRHHDIVLPESIPLKEINAYVISLYINKYPTVTSKDISNYFYTASDVLRLAVALSGGDISLVLDTTFISFPNRQRKLLLELLENSSNIEEDMKRYKNEWIRLGERLHPKKYPNLIKVNEAFDKIRNNKSIYSWKGLVNIAIEAKDYKKAVALLKQRPGEFARSLDHILRINDEKGWILISFKEVSKEISSQVLLQVMNHFRYRSEERYIITDFEVYCINKGVEPISNEVCLQVVDICKEALVHIYQQREDLGNVYVSTDYQKYFIPRALKNASKANKTYTKGSRISLNKDTNYIRGFIWWTNVERCRTDVDLSMIIINEDFQCMGHVSYTNLREKEFNCCHSGDIVDGGPQDGLGVAEFIDIDINKVKEQGARYIVFGVYNFTNIPFAHMPNMKFGWMERQGVNSGELFEPSTVKQRIDLFGGICNSCPVIFDCLNREFIWVDLGIDTQDLYYQNLENSEPNIINTCRIMCDFHGITLYELISLHIKARGKQVDSKEDADIIFDLEEGITPLDLDVFVGEYL